MTGAKVSPLRDPLHTSEDDFIFTHKKTKFHSRIFVINKSGGDNEEYEELMNSLYPFCQDSNLIPNPYSNIIRSIDKEGNIVIHIEYLELTEEDPTWLKKAKDQAEKEGRSGDDEYIDSLAQKYGGPGGVNW